jgi:hypothetical protein
MGEPPCVRNFALCSASNYAVRAVFAKAQPANACKQIADDGWLADSMADSLIRYNIVCVLTKTISWEARAVAAVTVKHI